MTRIGAATFLTLASALNVAATPMDDLVARVQAVKADQVDSALPHIPLRRWLQAAIGPGGTIVWERSDCDLKPDQPEPNEGYPVCVLARGSWKDRQIVMKVHFLASTSRGHRVDPPQFQPQSFVGCASANGWSSGGAMEKLSALPEAVQELKVTGDCK
jgi:hypothetical protein